MTKVVSVQVYGLAGRREPVHFNLNDDTNIFFGLNGSGKTTLLRLIFSALQNDISFIRRAPFERATVTFGSTDTSRPITRTIEAQTVEITPINPPQIIQTLNGPIAIPFPGPQAGWTSNHDAPLQFPASYLTVFRLFGDPHMNFWGGGNDSPYSEARLDQQFLQLVHNRWINYSNQLLSQIRSLQDEGIAQIIRAIFAASHRNSRGSGDAERAYAIVKHFLDRRALSFSFSKGDFIKRFSEDASIRDAVSRIERIEARIVKAEEPRLNLERLVGSFLTTNKQLKFSEQGIEFTAGGKTLGVDLLSSGEKHLVRILLECLSAQGDCILIDEPELSLHIDWQHELVRAMQTVNPALQIIMATHSPEIMADVPDGKIFEII